MLSIFGPNIYSMNDYNNKYPKIKIAKDLKLKKKS